MIYASVPVHQVLAHLDATLGACEGPLTASQLDRLLSAIGAEEAQREIDVEIEVDLDEDASTDTGAPESRQPVFMLMVTRRAA